MFEDSLIESGGRLRTRRGATTTISFVLQALLVGVLVLLPLIMVGQDLKTKALQDHTQGLHEDLHDKLAEHHARIHARLDELD